MAFRQPGLVVNTREWSALNRYFISQIKCKSANLLWTAHYGTINFTTANYPRERYSPLDSQAACAAPYSRYGWHNSFRIRELGLSVDNSRSLAWVSNSMDRVPRRVKPGHAQSAVLCSDFAEPTWAENRQREMASPQQPGRRRCKPIHVRRVSEYKSTDI
jgi:hypothetical protein